MVRCEEHILAIEVIERNIGRESLLCMHQDEFGLGLQLYQFEHFLECDALPVVIKTTPASNTVKVTVGLYLWQPVEFFPGQSHRLFHQPAHAEVPSGGIET